VRLNDDYSNQLNIYLGIFEDGLPRLDTIVLTSRDFDILKAILNILKYGF
jgi:hypothetical protein